MAVQWQQSFVKVLALSIRCFSSGQRKGRTALHIKCGGQTDPRLKWRGRPRPHIRQGGRTGPHTGHIQSEPGRPLGTDSSDRQHTAQQTYITSGSSSAPSLRGFSPFLTFHCGQSPYATIAWRIPFGHNAVLQQHGQSRPATKHDILCCSASISCALIHLNTASVQFKYGSKHLNSTSVLLNAASILRPYILIRLTTSEYSCSRSKYGLRAGLWGHSAAQIHYL